MKKDKCRICLEEGATRSLFEEWNSLTISAEIMSVANVQIYPEDGLPGTICRKCIKLFNKCIQFIRLCEESDIKLRAAAPNLRKSKCRIIKKEQSPNEGNEDSNDCSIQNSTSALSSEVNTAYDIKESDSKNHRKNKQQCTICGKILSSRFRLQTHLRIHSGERPYSCMHCSKSFALKTVLDLHLRIHTGEKPLTCNECKAAFRHPSSLRAHMRIHTGDTPYSCILCSKSFHTASNLQYHLRKHTGEKNFECDCCGKAFISRGHLQQHLLLHSGDKPHMCSVCGLRLSRASHLKRHLINLHKVATASSLEHEPDRKSREENLDIKISELH